MKGKRLELKLKCWPKVLRCATSETAKIAIELIINKLPIVIK